MNRGRTFSAIVRLGLPWVFLLGLGCSSSEAEEAEALPRIEDDAAAASRAACEFQAGALPYQTLGKSDRIGKQIPIDHVILIMMENRSFDHYFAKLKEYGQPDVDVSTDAFQNPNSLGEQVARFHATEYCVDDPSHGWNAVHEQYADGANTGFVTSNEPNGARAMGYFDETDIPFYYELANQAAISDTYHSSLLGPTWPNRMYFYGGSSHGLTKNTLPTEDVPSSFSELIDKGVEWTVYRTNLTPEAMYFQTIIDSTEGCSNPESGLPCRVKFVDDFFTDLAAGNLPPVVHVDPAHSTGIDETSEHPPANMQLGQHWLWKVVDAVTKSPLWNRTALFITYDEHGGFADHVPPPPACDPGTGAPEEGAQHGGFDRLGIRVPVYVLSPYAKRHYVSHVTHDHTSILRFVQARFGLPALSNRDANADAMMDMFDFDAPPQDPPTFVEPTVDPAKNAACQAAFPDGN